MAQPGSADDIENPHRRERAAIAAQACQTCRSRKSKCDEKRPKCGLCQRLNLDCQYREPLPTKKDKTMTQILDALQRLESKFDNLPHPPIQANLAAPRDSSSASPSPLATTSAIAPASIRLEQLSVSHRILIWPSIYLHLVHSNVPAVTDLQAIIQKGSSWLVEQEIKHAKPLELDPALPAVSLHHQPASNVTFSWLSIQQVQSYTEAYFHTFNVLYPILDHESFTNIIVPPLLRDGYGYGDSKSVLALLVFALGQVALQGTLGSPINTASDEHNHGVSGIRGGSVQHPPGLETFNEALKRISFVADRFSIESVQCHLLQAMYYGANGLHLDFWRSTTAASTACQIVLCTTTADWNSIDSDILKRVYWVCHLNESICQFDLCLPTTGIHTLQQDVPLPLHNEYSEGWTADEKPQHQYSFAAVLALEKLISDINLNILEPSAEQSKTASPFHGPRIPLVREMARQLDAWRLLLPHRLQWLDNEMFDFPSIDTSKRRPTENLFAPDQGAVPIRHRYNLDIATAYLRSRFYYARFLIYEAFVYKVLHFPELLTTEDADCAASAIRSVCMWPMIMAPPKDKKRLVPYLFTWTQALLGILLILEMTRVNPTLRGICEERIDADQVQKTVALMLDWLRDVKQFDGIAAWSWPIVESLFHT